MLHSILSMGGGGRFNADETVNALGNDLGQSVTTIGTGGEQISIGVTVTHLGKVDGLEAGIWRRTPHAR